MDINLKVEIGLAPQAIECVTLLACAIDGLRGKAPSQAAQAPAQAPATQAAPAQAAQAPAQAQQPAPPPAPTPAPTPTPTSDTVSKDVVTAYAANVFARLLTTPQLEAAFKSKILAKIQDTALQVSGCRTNKATELTASEFSRLKNEIDGLQIDAARGQLVLLPF